MNTSWLQRFLRSLLAFLVHVFGLVLAGPSLHDFSNTTEEASFLSMFIRDVGGGVHDDLVGSLQGNHGGYLNWEVLLCSVKSADTTCHL